VDAVIAHRETEVVMNDALVEALRIDLVAVHRGLYRVGPRGETRRSAKPQHRSNVSRRTALRCGRST
jgi:hypothetical protein